tara:strand:- start:840 stop:1040 length:201 start_codon:yes stop_codon:yes gene_type:complete
MAVKCDKCPALIHSSRQLCNKCNGTTAKAFDKAPTKTRGGMVAGKWESGNARAARAGIDKLKEMLE